MPIDRTAAKENYKKGASNNAEKLVDNYVRKTGKLDAAKSDAAEQLYADKVQDAINRKARQKGLNKVSEAEMNAAMKATGAQNYRSGTTRAADKQARNVEPYYAALDSLEGNLPERTSDPMANLMNRAGAVVQTMVETKKRLEG